MKKEIIIWQIIVLILGLFLIYTLKTYLEDRNSIIAETNRATCLINVYEKGLDLTAICQDIKTYKLQDDANGF